jgi:hypothetical protein
MTDLNALAKLAPFTVASSGFGGDVFCGSDWKEMDCDAIAAALNEWAELRAYRERTEAALAKLSRDYAGDLGKRQGGWTWLNTNTMRQLMEADIDTLKAHGLWRDPAPKEATDGN